jgi:hypothetical protein
MARTKRPIAKVLFLGDAQFAPFTEGVGAFVPSPVAVQQVAQTAIRLLSTAELS